MSDIRIGVIGGSGLGGMLGEHRAGPLARHTPTTPFGPPSAEITEVRIGGLPVFLLPRHGPGHLLNPSQVPYRANIFALKRLGVTHILASCAVGSLREEFRPRDLVIADQVIDKTRRPATFFDDAAVHVEFAEPFCPVLRGLLTQEGLGLGALGLEDERDVESLAGISSTNPKALSPKPTLHAAGCYVAMEGPAFSTRAEAHMHRIWGGDLIGMTGMPEAKLAREAEIAYAMVALVTDYDCWRTHAGSIAADGDSLLAEIIGNLDAASRGALTLINRVIEVVAAHPAAVADCPAHHALRRAIWSDKTKIPKETVDRLAPLWLKYFPPVPPAGTQGTG